MSSAPRVKGSVILLRLAFLEQRYTEDDRERVLQHVPIESAEVLRQQVFPGSWYPMSVFLDLNQAVDRVLGDGDSGLIREMGRFSAELGLKGTYQAFLRQGSPEFILQRGKAIWKQFYDSGRVEVDAVEATTARFRIYDFGAPSQELCHALHGWIERSLELVGALGVRVVETECAARGGRCCDFKISWEGSTRQDA